MKWLAAASAAAFAAALALTGTLLPLRTASGVEYLFVWSGAASTFGWGAAAAALFAAAYFATGRDASWLKPLTLLGLLPLGLLPAVTGVGVRGAPAAYFFYDLRWWWVAGIIAASVARADRAGGRRLNRIWQTIQGAPLGRRRLAFDVLLFAGVVTFAVSTTPPWMFDGRLVGDEPKYLRFDETWYQGHGFDISQNTHFSEIPLNAPSAFGRNLVHLATAVYGDAKTMAADTAGFARHPLTFRWNRAHGGDGFVTGKNGAGTYQMHMPGLSAMLFPGYYLDRRLIGYEPGYDDEFPRELWATSLTTLLMFGLAAVLLFRFLEAALGDPALAFAGAALASVTLPASAFAFQFYPEIPALCLILYSARRVIFSAGRDAAGRWSSILSGAAAGGVLWMHPRFAGVSIVLAAAAAWRWRGPARRRFFIGWLLVVGSVGLYAYHITGSWLPNALFTASGDVDVSVARIPDNFIGYFLHRDFGIMANAPWLLLAIPGFAVLARTARQQALWVILMISALVAAASSHALSDAGGTPDRFITAVVPLLAWPALAMVRAFWKSHAFRAVFAMLAAASVETAITYNDHFSRFSGQLNAQEIAGWRPLLAFSDIRFHFHIPPQPGFAGMAAIVVALAAFAWLAWKHAGSRPPATRRIPAAVAILAVIGAVTLLTASPGDWVHEGFFIRPRATHDRAMRSLVALDRCRICFTSLRRQVDWTWLQPNGAETPALTTTSSARRVVARIDLGGTDQNPAFGRVTVNFGDGSPLVKTSIVGAGEVAHDYAGAGTYLILAELLTPSPRTGRTVVTLENR